MEHSGRRVCFLPAGPVCGPYAAVAATVLSVLCLWIGVLLLPLQALASDPSQTRPETRLVKVGVEGQPVVGSGAHFVWILFKDLQADLERHIGRPIKLYGEDSMYGVGCNAGIKMARRNSPEMETFGFVCCPLSTEEAEKEGLTVYPLALEPIYIIVHESNPIDSLTLEQVRAIFSGRIRNWREVGGPDRSIVVVTRLHCKQRPGHWKTILPTADDFRKDRINVKGAKPMVRTVSDFSNAIGHVGSGWQIKPDDRIKIIRVNGYEPTAENLKAGNYPFYRLQSIVTYGPVSRDVAKIIEFMKKSEEFNRVARKYNMLRVDE